MFQKKNCVWF